MTVRQRQRKTTALSVIPLARLVEPRLLRLDVDLRLPIELTAESNSLRKNDQINLARDAVLL